MHLTCSRNGIHSFNAAELSAHVLRCTESNHALAGFIFIPPDVPDFASGKIICNDINYVVSIWRDGKWVN